MAVINLDVIPLWGENNDVTITGYGHSDLDDRIEKIAIKYGRDIQTDPINDDYSGLVQEVHLFFDFILFVRWLTQMTGPSGKCCFFL